jgi:phosphopantothenoylcysteine decarboxylase/phosphopantothenate--cysteine ligase
MSLDSSCFYVRHPRATAISTAKRCLFTVPGQDTHVLDDIDAERVSLLWETLASPVSVADLRRVLDMDGGHLTALLGKLLELGLAVEGEPGEPPSCSGLPAAPRVSKLCRHLILGVTGAVQSAFTASYAWRLATEAAQEVDVVLTRAARRFVRPLALTACGVRVWSAPFEQRGEVTVPHVHLARLADLVLVLPATARTLFRLAHGTCDDLLSLVVCATEAPVLIVPSMNPVMWRNPAVQRNVSLLRRDGRFIVEPGQGFEVADGRSWTEAVGSTALGPFSAGLIPSLEAVLRLAGRLRD